MRILSLYIDWKNENNNTLRAHILYTDTPAASLAATVDKFSTLIANVFARSICYSHFSIQLACLFFVCGCALCSIAAAVAFLFFYYFGLLCESSAQYFW